MSPQGESILRSRLIRRGARPRAAAGDAAGAASGAAYAAVADAVDAKLGAATDVGVAAAADTELGPAAGAAIGVAAGAAVGALIAAVVMLAGCGGGSGSGSSTAAAESAGAGVVLAELDTAAIRGRHPTSLFGIPPAAARAEILRVVDGDTVEVVFAGGRTENVRLIGIDTPEKPGGRLPAECFGAEASAFASILLSPGTPVLLTGGAETRDVYDRLLAYVHRASDGLLVNMALAREGFADALSIPPNTDYSAHFADAVEAARAENLGLWAACGGPDTPLEG